jgi:hypothetical protein
MQRPFSVRLSITDGPVRLLNGGAGVSATFDVWDGITSSEYFPAGTEQAFYQLAVEKSATQPEDVPQIKNELTWALLRIAETWSFSGGSDILIKTREVIISPKFESNAAEVKRLLLNAQGRTEVRVDARKRGQALAAGEADRASRLLGITRALRGWMIADRLGRDRRHRLPSPHQPRRRRDWLGDPLPTWSAGAVTRMHWASPSTQASRINGVALRIVSPARANTRFNDAQPFCNCPSSGCKALVAKI